MSDSTEFEIPKDTEKLSYKFILDSIEADPYKDLQVPPELEPIAEHGAMLPLPAASVSQCGTQAELPIDIELEAHDSIPMSDLDLPAGKKYFRIGEVAELIGVEPYVLRYWESEFSVIRPVKSGSGHRVYSRKDVEALHLIRHLLHIEKYSIKGAKKKFMERKKEVKEAQGPSRQYLRELTSELKELIQIIRGS